MGLSSSDTSSCPSTFISYGARAVTALVPWEKPQQCESMSGELVGRFQGENSSSSLVRAESLFCRRRGWATSRNAREVAHPEFSCVSNRKKNHRFEYFHSDPKIRFIFGPSASRSLRFQSSANQ